MTTPGQKALDKAAVLRAAELAPPASSTPPATTPPATDDLAARVVADVYAPGGAPAPHDGVLRDVPTSWDWDMHSKRDQWPPLTNGKYANPWVTCFPDGNAPFVAGCSLQVSRMLMFSSNDGTSWDTFGPTSLTIDGGAWHYDSSGRGDVGKLSFTAQNQVAQFPLDVLAPGKWNVAHFWPSAWWPKPAYPGTKFIATVISARVLAPAGTKPRFLLGCSGDVVSGPTVSGAANPALGIPAHRLVGIDAPTRHGYVAGMSYSDLLKYAPAIASKVKP